MVGYSWMLRKETGLGIFGSGNGRRPGRKELAGPFSARSRGAPLLTLGGRSPPADAPWHSHLRPAPIAPFIEVGGKLVFAKTIEDPVFRHPALAGHLDAPVR